MLGYLSVAGLSVFTVFAVFGRFSRRGVEGRELDKSTVAASESFFSHLGRAVTEKERDVVRAVRKFLNETPSRTCWRALLEFAQF